jgi:hypothetical protein
MRAGRIVGSGLLWREHRCYGITADDAEQGLVVARVGSDDLAVETDFGAQDFAAIFGAALAADSVVGWASASGAEFMPMSADQLRVRIRSQRAILSRYRAVIAASE